MTEIKKEQFEYQGIPVSYHKVGSGPPLLILHGWGSSSRVMLPVARTLSDIRTCYVPDLPGFGETPPPGIAWGITEYTEFTRVFTREVIGESTDVLAHSFGGRIVLKWAGTEASADDLDPVIPGNESQNEHQEELKKIIITGGAGMKPKRSFSYYRRRCTASILKAPFVLLPNALKIKANEWLRNTSLWKSLGSSDYQKLDGVMRETFVRSVSEHLEYCLPRISHEVLLLWGKEDEATPWYQAERMEKGLKNGALVGIDRAGHYAFLDQPDRFQRIARAFLIHDNA